MANISKNIGDAGEDIAARFLESKGYEILEKNFRVRGWEIDLIAKKEEKYFFVEVKFRKNSDFSHPLELFDFRKAKPFMRTFFEYISEKNIDADDCQIDLIGILPTESGYRIFHKKSVEIDFENLHL